MSADPITKDPEVVTLPPKVAVLEPVSAPIMDTASVILISDESVELSVFVFTVVIVADVPSIVATIVASEVSVTPLTSPPEVVSTALNLSSPSFQ
jgi:hypothetical protein